MTTPPAAKFFVNHGVVSSRTDMLHLLRPLLKQTVTYRYLRGREVVSHGTGWVERIVVDADESSTYFTPLAISLNIDSFEHLEFETRPDQLLVYTLVQGDERVVVEFAPVGPGAEDDVAVRADASSRSRCATTSRWSCRASRSRTRSSQPGVGPPRDLAAALAAHVRDPQGRRRPDAPSQRLARADDHDDDHEQVRQHLEEERRRAAGLERVVEAEDRRHALDVEDEPRRSPRTGRPRWRPGAGSTGRRSRARWRSSRARATVWSPNQPGRDRERDGRAGQPGQEPADEHVGVARPVDVDALGVGGRRVARRPPAGAGPAASG